MLTASSGLSLREEISVDSRLASRASAVLRQDALNILEATSRTFFIPISRLPPGLLEAVASGYLCLRAIDEIEDHPSLEARIKEELLRDISRSLQAADRGYHPCQLLVDDASYQSLLPEVTLRIVDWVRLAPDSFAPRIWDAVAAMADRMADWATCGWMVRSEADLDRYTFSVAGAVGLMLSDIWAWYDGTLTDRICAIGFGRGLQSVNILRNHQEDLARGVDFFPPGWKEPQMQAYSRRNLALGDAYLLELPPGPVSEFCRIPLALAHATLEGLAAGRQKLDRQEVLKIVSESLTPLADR